MMTSHETFKINDEMRPISPSISLDELINILNKAGIPLDEYGKGAAKKVENLHEELSTGESVMSVHGKYEITRDVNVVWIDVLCTLSNGDVYILREDRQELKDGRVRKRSTPASLGEKMQGGEDLDVAIERALNEEIGVSTISSLHKIGENEEKFTPPTYPGLESTYSSHTYVAVIPESAYIADGYVEHQAEKDNYYVWDLLHKATPKT